MDDSLPPGQQLVARERWPIIGERQPPAIDGPFRLRVSGLVREAREIGLAELLAASRPFQVDLHCVTRWSIPGMEFGGVLLAEVLEGAGVDPAARFVSFVSRSATGHHSSLPLTLALELGTFLATTALGLPLAPEHGGPLRNMVPGRYFYKSVKWLGEIRLLAEDRLGTWEQGSGYHNEADPWREQRYMAAALDKRLAARLIASRDFRGLDLRSIEAAHRDLRGLRAGSALLRDARFQGAQLAGSDFAKANLSNACFRQADLRQAAFAGADIEGAAFEGADLRGADFTECAMTGSTFVTGDLAARIDAGTRFSRAGLAALAGEQAAYVSDQRPEWV